MELNQYQLEAQKTDRVPAGASSSDGTDLIVPLLGLAGEAGELLSEYKKHLRDGDSHQLFKERVAEELGDLLWYIANVATKFNLSLQEIAEANLYKTKNRWSSRDSSETILDAGYDEQERFPRKFEIELGEVMVKGRKKVRVKMNGKKIGDELTDNSDDPDGYRFHDVFHLGYVAVLGWSPVARKIMERKRKSNLIIDEVQDGGRAQVIDEGVAALVFEYAKGHNWLEGVTILDYQLLRTIKSLTSFLEVKIRSMNEWQKAILVGYEVWRQVVKNNGGIIFVDLDAKTLTYKSSPLKQYSQKQDGKRFEELP